MLEGAHGIMQELRDYFNTELAATKNQAFVIPVVVKISSGCYS